MDYLPIGVKENLFQVLDKLEALTDLLKNFKPEEMRLPKKIDILVEDITLELGVSLSDIEWKTIKLWKTFDNIVSQIPPQIITW